jgi:hypothetical protein
MKDGSSTACKCLKIPKVSSETVKERTDNTMTKRKWINELTIIHKTLHRKLKIELHETWG